MLISSGSLMDSYTFVLTSSVLLGDSDAFVLISSGSLMDSYTFVLTFFTQSFHLLRFKVTEGTPQSFGLPIVSFKTTLSPEDSFQKSRRVNIA